MSRLQNPPERHIDTPHPYTQFCHIYKDTITPPNTIHKQLYDYIHLDHNPINLEKLQEKFPYLPRQLLMEALRYNEPINEYTRPNPPITYHSSPLPNPVPLTS